MIIRPYNDIHNEVDVYNIPVLEGEKDTVLSLAGDIYDRKHISKWLHPLAERFKHIILVLGNHDYWNGDIDLVPRQIRKYLSDNNLTNVHLLTDSWVDIDEYTFYGGTLWTDFNHRDPITMYSYAPFKDYNKIRWSQYERRITTQFILVRHERFLMNFKNLVTERPDRKLIVVSHHAPLTLSIDPQYADQRIHNGFYASDLSNLILDHPQIVLWHHGHTHTCWNYQLGGTRVICNPRGYLPKYPVDDFNAELVLDLNQLIEPDLVY